MQLQVEALWDQYYSDADIFLALDDLPPDLPTTYRRCLERIDQQRQGVAAKVLRWVCFARRPLSADELREVVSFDLSDDEWNAKKLQTLSSLISSCANLVWVEHISAPEDSKHPDIVGADASNQSVRLIHPSVKQYLLGPESSFSLVFHLDAELAVTTCGEECVNYLSFKNFGLQLQQSTVSITSLPSPETLISQIAVPAFAKRLLSWRSTSQAPQKVINITRPPPRRIDQVEHHNYQFLRYAREYWALQTKSISSRSRAWTKFQHLALHPNNSWEMHPWATGNPSHQSDLRALLGWATREEHMPLLDLLVQRQKQYKTRDFCNLPLAQDGFPALHLACRLGFLGVVQLLLGICDVNAPGPEARTALSYAVEKDHTEVARTVLHQSGVIFATTVVPIAIHTITQGFGLSLLGLAVNSGSAGMVSLILNTQVSISPERADETNPLVLAASSGHSEVLYILLQSSACSWTDDVCDLAYLSAVRNGHEETVRLMLEHGNADPYHHADNGRTPLSLAARKGHTAVVRLLLAHDNGARYTRALHEEVCKDCNETVIATLLAAGADVNAQGGKHGDALQAASANGREVVVQTLLAKGANINTHNGQYGNALQAASAGGYEAIVQTLLARGADINTHSGRHGNALQAASVGGHRAIVETLLSRGANVNAYGGYYGYALQAASANGHKAIVQILLAVGADVNALGGEYGGALQAASANGHRAIVRTLLARGADVNARGGLWNRSAFYAASQGHHWKIADMLVAAGAIH